MSPTRRTRRAKALTDPDPTVSDKASEDVAGDLTAFANARQRRYAEQRRAWAEAIGRPYEHKADPRPPPGELDDVADDE